MANQNQQSPTIDPLKPGCYLRVTVLAACLGMSKNSIWRLARDPKNNFPRPIKLSEKITVWSTDSILQWLASKEAA